MEREERFSYCERWFEAVSNSGKSATVRGNSDDRAIKTNKIDVSLRHDKRSENFQICKICRL